MSIVEAARVEVPESKYRVLAQLGEGGTASVYLAVARGPSGFNKLVVLKTIKTLLADDPDFRRMFLQEARVAARLSHPGIVQTYEVIEAARAPIIVMEYLEGEPLSKVLMRARGELSLAMHLRVIADATSALHYAHELTDFDGRPLGLVHRDMTPHNIILTFDGQTKLLDFGIAKLTQANPETQTGVIKGKLRYMPPEQIAGESIDRRADIYAVGVMLWEAATGEAMWKGCSDATVMDRVLNGEITPPSEVRPGVPAQLDAICMKALSFDPAGRHATAAELEAELEALLDGLGSRVSARAIGKVMSQLFADVRVETKALIEKQLSEVALLSPEEYEAMGPAVMNGGRGGPFSLSAVHAVGTPARRSLRSVGWLALAGVVGLVAAAGIKLATPVGPPAAAPSAVPDHGSRPTASGLPAISPARVLIHVTASPAEATLLLDGELLPNNGFARLLPADGSQHIVTAQAPGYDTRSAAFLSDHDHELSLVLARTKSATATTARPHVAGNASGAGSARVTPSASQAPRPGPDCNPPYRIDSAGIKTFRVECL
jgi:eukaryotic-like serine/threonine-protein kinase